MGGNGALRRLTTILAADVVGYSRLMAADEAGTLARLKAHRKELVEPKVAQYRGRTIKLMGDGALMEFASVVDAVAFAVEVQCAMPARNADMPEDRQICYRIGINVGDVIVDGDDIYGDGVNIAARLEGLAEPGGICISRSVHTQVKGKLDLTFEHLGEKEIKNIPEPVTVYRVAPDDKAAALATPVVREATRRERRWMLVAAAAVAAIAPIGGLIWWQSSKTDEEPASIERMAFPLPDKPSIAVLPFDNMSDDSSQEYFADGMAEDLITDLSKISGLFVIARNSSFSYRGQQVEVRRVAEELGVRYVLEGSVRRVGQQVRINVQLVDATTGGHLWAERFDGTLDDVFAFQDQVTEKSCRGPCRQSVRRGNNSATELRHNPRPGSRRLSAGLGALQTPDTARSCQGLTLLRGSRSPRSQLRSGTCRARRGLLGRLREQLGLRHGYAIVSCREPSE